VFVCSAHLFLIAVNIDPSRANAKKAGAHILTIKPGFVDGPMTRDFKKGLLWAQPEDIAIGITEAIEK
jgi:decaprenylphospho-beta-D-erythro-pentofuranosid-2-ulose 2-reductase